MWHGHWQPQPRRPTRRRAGSRWLPCGHCATAGLTAILAVPDDAASIMMPNGIRASCHESTEFGRRPAASAAARAPTELGSQSRSSSAATEAKRVLLLPGARRMGAADRISKLRSRQLRAAREAQPGGTPGGTQETH
jgi:hypothetical protein